MKMKKINLEGLEETVTYEKSDNGLDIYVYKNKDFHSYYAYFITNYGALNNEFIPINESDYQKFPDGIAHFLEHKMFEKDSGNVMQKFPLIGGSTNAFTSYTHTAYQVSGSENFYKNLELLLNFVQEPYFTDENVEKEKGIIKQELFMGKDKPYREFHLQQLRNLFVNLRYGVEIVGEENDIDSITKEDLYKCYNTFYNPSNMCIIVITNEEEEKVIKFIRDNQSSKKIEPNNKIQIKEINEPDKVKKEYEVIYKDVSKGELSYSFKINSKDYDTSIHKLELYLYILFQINFGKLTGFGLKLKEKGLINGNIGIGDTIYNNHIVVTINMSTDYPEEIIKILDEKINNLTLNEEYFNMIKKSMISNFVYYFTEVSSIMDYLYSSYVNNKEIVSNGFMDYRELSFNELNDIYKKTKLENKSIIVMKPLKSKE